MATCSKCNGSGEITCPECGGGRYYLCICGESGSVDCPQCKGTGQVENDKFTGGSSSAPSSSGGSSSYSAPPPPKPAPQIKNDDVYEGDVVNGKLNGKGKHETPSFVYVGDFVEGFYHGKGKLTWKNSLYPAQEGNWEYGKFIGKAPVSKFGSNSTFSPMQIKIYTDLIDLNVKGTFFQNIARQELKDGTFDPSKYGLRRYSADGKPV